MGAPRLTFEEADQARWDDLAELFEGRGGPKNCWCMAWRKKPAEARQGDTESRKAALKGALRAQVTGGTPIGILAYHDGAPIAWCSIAPRSTYRRLGGPDDFADDPDAVWSLVCFFIKREFRGQDMTSRLLDAAILHARNRGARVVEAYPVDPDSPSYRFMGIVGVFERAGFEKFGTAGSRRHVMRLAFDEGASSAPTNR